MRLVICCDGTWNKADQEKNGRPCPTNVIKLAYRVAKRPANATQVVFYDQGVGTGNFIDRVSGGAFGDGLVDNIFDAYRFLIANYHPGDEIFLFGFSRGAFTARSVAGMIRKCGIVKRTSIDQYVPALNLYRADDVHPNDKAAKDFRAVHACDGAESPPIRFIGVWDTVGSLGIPLRGLRGLTRRKHVFHDTQLSSTVQTARHALAIDEHRAPFEPTIWDEDKPHPDTVQMWFAGAHSGVGGGYAESELSDIALEWMLDEAQKAGLVLDEEVLATRPLAPNPLGALHNSKTGLYRLTKGIDRRITLGRTQQVHSSVLARWEVLPDYRPRSLADIVPRSREARAGMTTPASN